MRIKKSIKKTLLVLSLPGLLLLLFYNLPEKKKQYKSNHFTFIFSNSIDTIAIRSLAEILEESYLKIGHQLNTTPPDHIETNIYATWWKYGKATGNWGASGSIEGPSKLHFAEKAWSEHDNKKVAIHEFTHAVVLKKLIDQETQPFNTQIFEQKFAMFPAWLWEAISCYEADQINKLKDQPFLANGKYPSLKELNTRSGNKIYIVGYSIIDFIVQEYGHAKLLELISNYGNLQKVLNISEAEFSKQWYAFIKTKY